MYSALISANGKGGQWEEALKVFEDLKKDNVAPNTIITYSALISAYEKGGQWKEALKVLEAMKKDNVKQDNITYSALISVCGKGC
jgi:pentatricopeptide repeat domain-containing protein 1